MNRTAMLVVAVWAAALAAVFMMWPGATPAEEARSVNVGHGATIMRSLEADHGDDARSDAVATKQTSKQASKREMMRVQTRDDEVPQSRPQSSHKDHVANNGDDKAKSITDIIDPASFQPFYSYPCTNAGKVLLTSLVFGFDVSFKPRTSKSYPVFVLGILSRIAFASLAINTWMLDIKRFSTSPMGLSDALLCWTMSSNIPSALAIWWPLILQAPSNLFANLKPKYIALGGIPIIPGTVKWLPVDKHLYALILAPYFLPLLPISYGIIHQLVGSAISCLTYVMTCKACCCCVAWSLLTIFTLTLWSYAKDNVGLYFFQERGWMVWQLISITMVNLFIGHGFAVVYAKVMGASTDRMVSFITEFYSNAMMASGAGGEKDIWGPFRQFQDLSDFEDTSEQVVAEQGILGDGGEGGEHGEGGVDEHLGAQPTDDDIAIAKASLMFKMVDKSNDITIYSQIFIITVLRAVHDNVGWFDSLEMTLSERHVRDFVEHLRVSGSLGFQQVFDLLWRLL